KALIPALPAALGIRESNESSPMEMVAARPAIGISSRAMEKAVTRRGIWSRGQLICTAGRALSLFEFKLESTVTSDARRRRSVLTNFNMLSTCDLIHPFQVESDFATLKRMRWPISRPARNVLTRLALKRQETRCDIVRHIR